MSTRPKFRALNLCAGDLVEVRSAEEIFATLDADARLDNLPFMPEMLRYCGQRLRVYKRAHKTCDNIEQWSLRRMRHAVHLEAVRCDGDDHGGCQAGCLIFWHEAWLRRAGPEIEIAGARDRHNRSASSDGGEGVDKVMRASRRPSEGAGLEPIYSCQATELRKFTENLPWWDVRQFIADVSSRNLVTGLSASTRSDRLLETALSILQVLRAIVIAAFNGVQGRRHASLYPHIEGLAAQTFDGKKLDLQPGELAQVKSKAEIAATLNAGNKNRGLLFEGEMLPFCGGIYRVMRRVDRIINEKNGKMLHMKHPCIILEGAFCRGDNHLYCPRAIHSYWREEWLMRADGNARMEPVSEACRNVCENATPRNGA